MKTLYIKESLIPNRFGSWQRNLILRGHIPGNLSLANLRGTASAHSDRYANSRKTVEDWIAIYGVESRLYLCENHRWCRVWVEAISGEQVQIKIID